jgi:ABC-type ATPase involved in cell division
VSFLRIQNLYKTFGQVAAVNRINIDIAEGEFFTMLGSSGCGKTTTLRMVGGLEKPDGGEIHLGDQCLVAPDKNLFIKPEKRNMGMVFQSYALWPHMTVFENVAYPLKLRGIKGAQASQKVEDVLALVGLAGLGERPAPALSGGQQQRVALARALVFSPKEPRPLQDWEILAWAWREACGSLGRAASGERRMRGACARQRARGLSSPRAAPRGRAGRTRPASAARARSRTTARAHAPWRGRP